MLLTRHAELAQLKPDRVTPELGLQSKFGARTLRIIWSQLDKSDSGASSLG